MRKYSFSQRVINEWNKLPIDCVNASSVNMFKNRIDRYLMGGGGGLGWSGHLKRHELDGLYCRGYYQ